MFDLSESKRIRIKQIREIAELFGFETKNQYRIIDQDDVEIGRAVEFSPHFGHFLLRQFFGHWRKYEILFLDSHDNKILRGVHPFNFFLHELHIHDHTGKKIGVIKQRASIFYRRFEIQGLNGRKIFKIKSPWFKLWTFNIERMGRKEASIIKKWSGLLDETLFDKDNFNVNFFNDELDPRERNLILAASIFIDLMYFEKKAGR